MLRAFNDSASPSAMTAATNVAQRHCCRTHSASQSMLETTSPREPETAASTTSVARRLAAERSPLDSRIETSARCSTSLRVVAQHIVTSGRHSATTRPCPGRSVDRLVVVTKSNDEESFAALANLAPNAHWVVMSSDECDDYGVPVPPYFVLVDGSTPIPKPKTSVASHRIASTSTSTSTSTFEPAFPRTTRPHSLLHGRRLVADAIRLTWSP